MQCKLQMIVVYTFNLVVFFFLFANEWWNEEDHLTVCMLHARMQSNYMNVRQTSEKRVVQRQ